MKNSWFRFLGRDSRADSDLICQKVTDWYFQKTITEKFRTLFFVCQLWRGLYSNHDGFVFQSWWVCTPIMMGFYSNDDGFVLQSWWVSIHKSWWVCAPIMSELNSNDSTPKMIDWYSNHAGFVLQSWWVSTPIKANFPSYDDRFVLQWWSNCTHDRDELKLKKTNYTNKNKN